MSVENARTVAEWKRLLGDPASPASKKIAGLCLDDRDLIEAHVECYARTLDAFARAYDDDAEAFIVRAPARINLMGMHIDHRGGSINPIAIKELIMAVQKREDDQIVLQNVDAEAFPARQFRISEELPAGKVADWEEWTRQQCLERQAAGTAGDWSNYVKAATLFLQDMNKAADGRHVKQLSGMNIMMSSTIPVAAGLSSSSALVVGSAEAIMHINGLSMSPDEFIDMCGTAEWYVGTRGGKGDHAAIKLGKQGHVSHFKFFPTSVDFMPFPAEYRIVVCNTWKQAKKSAGAKDTFNDRVTSYLIGLMFVKKSYPQFAEKLVHFRDLNPANLGIDDAELYAMLKTLPESITRAGLAEALPERAEDLQKLYETHREPDGGYRVRPVCLFGIAECLRANMAVEKLRKGDVEGFGELMVISHSGDRVTRLCDGQRVPVDNSVPDAKLEALIADLSSGEPDRVEAARLSRQPGGYDVSCEELDVLVDLALGTDGVLGAGRIGAGLGGCMCALVRQENVATLLETFRKEYYEPRDLPYAAEVCIPVDGAGVMP